MSIFALTLSHTHTHTHYGTKELVVYVRHPGENLQCVEGDSMSGSALEIDWHCYAETLTEVVEYGK